MLSGSHRVVLIEIERDDVGEAESFFAVHPDQLPVRSDRGRSGSEPEHRPSAGGKVVANDRGDAARGKAADVVVIVDDDSADALESAHWDWCQGKGGNPTRTTV